MKQCCQLSSHGPESAVVTGEVSVETAGVLLRMIGSCRHSCALLKMSHVHNTILVRCAEYLSVTAYIDSFVSIHLTSRYTLQPFREYRSATTLRTHSPRGQCT